MQEPLSKSIKRNKGMNLKALKKRHKLRDQSPRVKRDKDMMVAWTRTPGSPHRTFVSFQLRVERLEGSSGLGRGSPLACRHLNQGSQLRGHPGLENLKVLKKRKLHGRMLMTLDTSPPPADP